MASAIIDLSALPSDAQIMLDIYIRDNPDHDVSEYFLETEDGYIDQFIDLVYPPCVGYNADGSINKTPHPPCMCLRYAPSLGWFLMGGAP
jgi:hypothetical protein